MDKVYAGLRNLYVYGLKKSPKYWNQKFCEFMYKESFKKSVNYPCLIYRKGDTNTKEFMYVLLYVDHLLFFGSNLKQINNFKKSLCENFKMKDLGLACNYLGIQIEQDICSNNVTKVHQKNYLCKILYNYNMSECRSIDTPIEQNFKFNILKRDESESPEIEKSCRKLIGSLLCACYTRPDLCLAVSILSRFQNCASLLLFECLKRVLRYIEGTLDLCLIYDVNNVSNDKMLEGSFL